MEYARITIPSKKDRKLTQITDGLWAVKGTYSGRNDFFEPSPLYSSPAAAPKVLDKKPAHKVRSKVKLQALPKTRRSTR